MTDPGALWARRATLVVFATQAVLFASWTAHIPLVKARLGLSDAELGLVLFGAPIGSVLAMLATIWLLPHLGSARMLRLGLFGYLGTGWLVGIAGSPLALFAALAVWGAFQGAADVSMNAQAVFVERRVGRPVMSGFHAGWSVGTFAGAGLGALAVAAGVPLAAQLIVLAVLGFVIGGTATRALVPDPPPHPEPEAAPRGVATVWLHPVVLALGAMALASMLCEGAAADWSAVYLHDALGTSPGIAALAYAAYSAAMVAQRLAGDRLLARYPARTLLPILAAVATVGMTAALVAGFPAAALVGFATLGIGLGLVVPVAFTAAGRLPGIHPGASVAAVSAIGWVGYVAGPPLIGHLADAVGLPLALGIVPLLTAVIVLTVRASRGFSPTAATAG